MNREWSELNKEMQRCLNRDETYEQGLEVLFQLRETMMKVLLEIREGRTREAFDAMPYAGADGYHSKTIAYSIWHIFRIEDIVAHSLIRKDEEVFFEKGYKEAIHTPIITTGNKLTGREIAEFSKQLDLENLYRYALEVKESTEELLRRLPYRELKRKFSEEDKERLRASGCVSADENACWLVDYWCGKDIRGLIRMPFSRHWIMHIEAILRIAKKG